MNTGDTGQFEPVHLAQWLETTRYFLFADLESLAALPVSVLPQLRQDSHGAHPREGLFRAATAAFALYRAEVAALAQ